MAKIEDERIDLCDGKYTVIFNNETGQFRALRYGDEWRDLSGDTLIFSMFCEIQQLNQRNQVIIDDHSKSLERCFFFHQKNYTNVYK